MYDDDLSIFLQGCRHFWASLPLGVPALEWVLEDFHPAVAKNALVPRTAWSASGGVGVNLPILTEIAISSVFDVDVTALLALNLRSGPKGGLRFWPGNPLWKAPLLVSLAMPWQEP